MDRRPINSCFVFVALFYNDVLIQNHQPKYLFFHFHGELRKTDLENILLAYSSTHKTMQKYQKWFFNHL